MSHLAVVATIDKFVIIDKQTVEFRPTGNGSRVTLNYQSIHCSKEFVLAFLNILKVPAPILDEETGRFVFPAEGAVAEVGTAHDIVTVVDDDDETDTDDEDAIPWKGTKNGTINRIGGPPEPHGYQLDSEEENSEEDSEEE